MTIQELYSKLIFEKIDKIRSEKPNQIFVILGQFIPPCLTASLAKGIYFIRLEKWVKE